MNRPLSEADILAMVNEWYPDSLISGQAAEAQGQAPVIALGRYVAAAVLDRYGRGAGDRENLERVAHALEVGSSALARLARRLRETEV